jgi:outer membrane murein-binding lipoprotein Lpp
MGLLDKAKQAAEQAAAKAKEGVEDVQTKRELSQAYNDLGKSTYELIGSGEISNPRLDAAAAKIKTLTEKLAAMPD